MVATYAVVSTAGGATHYYAKDDGYYARNDPEYRKGTFWYGKGAEELGLSKRVKPEVFNEILDGYVPDTDIRLGRKRDGEHQHRAGFDVTLSAPKSVSLAGLALGDKRVLAAHDEAVRTTLDFIENDLLMTRSYDPETRRVSKVHSPHMIAATFRHETSRNLDPQLHTHCVIANMTHDDEGQWKSVEPSSINMSKFLIGAYYRHELASELLKLGYEITPTTQGKLTSFEIKGYDRELLEQFSSRRMEIIDFMKAQGWHNTAKNTQKAALITRNNKVEVDRTVMHEKWKECFAEVTQDWEHRLVKPRMTANKAEILAHMNSERGQVAEEAMLKSIAHLEERHITFSRNNLLERSMAITPGQAGFEALSQACDNAQDQGILFTGWNLKGREVLTTGMAVSAEREILTRLENSGMTTGPIIEEGKLHKRIIETRMLEGQRDAVRLILGSEDRVVGIHGKAGTGKTTMLGHMREIAEAENMRVMGLAPTASAARTLERESGIPSVTLQSFLLHKDSIVRGTASELAYAAEQNMFSDVMLVVDESSLVGLRQMQDLLRISDALELPRLVLVGDSRQLEGVEAGAPFRLITSRDYIETAYMNENLRAQEPHLLEATLFASQGYPEKALESLQDSVIEVGRENMEQAAAEKWLNLSAKERWETLILAPMRWQRDEINSMIRDALKEEGYIGGDSLKIAKLESLRMTNSQKEDASNYSSGDLVIFAVDSPKLGIEASEVYRVTGVSEQDDGVIELMDMNGRRIDFDPQGGGDVRHDIAGRLDVFEESEMLLQAGDEIRWTRNDNERELLNASTASILEIDKHSITLETDDNREFVLDHGDRHLHHCDYAWASTVHGAQGKTSYGVIALLPSETPLLSNQKTFYVEVSRARHEAIIITDDKLDLADTLEAASGDTISALEAIGEIPRLDYEYKAEPEPYIGRDDKLHETPLWFIGDAPAPTETPAEVENEPEHELEQELKPERTEEKELVLEKVLELDKGDDLSL